MTLVVSDPSPPGTRRRTRSVLVVDDDPDIQLVLQFALEDAGYRPLPAPTGEAGLLIAHEADPDAALVDLRLPGLHGLDLIPSLRATSPMPILIITAQTAGRDTTTALSLGADDYLTKPFATRDLIHRLTTQLATPTPADAGDGRLRVTPTGQVLLDGEPVTLTCAERPPPGRAGHRERPIRRPERTPARRVGLPLPRRPHRGERHDQPAAGPASHRRRDLRHHIARQPAAGCGTAPAPLGRGAPAGGHPCPR